MHDDLCNLFLFEIVTLKLGILFILFCCVAANFLSADVLIESEKAVEENEETHQ